MLRSLFISESFFLCHKIYIIHYIYRIAETHSIHIRISYVVPLCKGRCGSKGVGRKIQKYPINYETYASVALLSHLIPSAAASQSADSRNRICLFLGFMCGRNFVSEITSDKSVALEAALVVIGILVVEPVTNCSYYKRFLHSRPGGY